MGHLPLLDELAVIAGLGVFVAVILARFQLPTVAGLLLAGALAGPFGFGLVSSISTIEILAELGVVLLLFTIGLEFSLTRLRNIFRQVAIGGFIQVALTALATVIVARILGVPTNTAIVYGFIFSLSSTAIVLRALSERRELDAPHGRFIVGVLIFQDLCVVPMVLIVPLLGADHGSDHLFYSVGAALLKASILVVATIFLARRIVPRVLHWVDRSRSREVFLLAVLGICIGAAWLTSLAGLSLALGAFLGGMLVADTDFGHRALAEVLSLRDAFVSIFFVSLGMLFNSHVVVSEPVTVALLLAGFLIAKGFLATLAALAMRFPARVAWLAGVGLAQFGEFGFVLARLAQSSGVITSEAVAPLFAAGVLSMFLTPVLVRAAPHVAAGEKLLAPLERLLGAASVDERPEDKESLSRHVVVVGYGVAGQWVARALQACGTPFLVLELNLELVRLGRARGLPVYYGDATSSEALHHASLETAATLVLVINDRDAALRVARTVRERAPQLPIVMRTRYLLDRRQLLQMGVTDVVAEEVESGFEIVGRVLRRLEVKESEIEAHLAEVRREVTLSDPA